MKLLGWRAAQALVAIYLGLQIYRHYAHPSDDGWFATIDGVVILWMIVIIVYQAIKFVAGEVRRQRARRG